MKFASSELAYVEVAKSECYFWGDTNAEAHFSVLKFHQELYHYGTWETWQLNGG
jgi:hypothetical protein